MDEHGPEASPAANDGTPIMVPHPNRSIGRGKPEVGTANTEITG